MFNLVRLTICAFTFLLIFGAPSRAQLQAPLKPDISAELLVGGLEAPNASDAWLGVRVNLGAGWKTYWRSPGDAGLPPEFDWSESSNLTTAEPMWPAPHRMTILGLETIGYTGEVVFPVKVQIANQANSTTFKLKLTVYACSTICVREERALTGTLQPAHRNDGAQSVIDAWRRKVPSAAAKSLKVDSITLLSDPPGLRIDAASTIPFENPDVFVESDPPVYGAKPQVQIADGNRATLTVLLPGERPDALVGRDFRVTVVDGTRAIEATSGGAVPKRSLETSNNPGAPKMAVAAQPLWRALLVALIGGIILNLMPCVFPVLSLKLLAFMNVGAGDRNHIRAGFTASAAGIVASFLVLATALAALKAAGATVGWGIQFQQPIFLGTMAIVLTLFAANLLGLFEFTLPYPLVNRLGSVGNASSLTSQFASGFVATLLATPCSAPFVGTAVGYALAGGPLEIYQVFAALGLGMASPYILVALFPRLAMLLPRPGRWMLTVKRLMAVALVGTAVWLLTIVHTSAGPIVALSLSAALILSLLALFLRRTERPRAVVAGSVLLFACAAVAVWAWPSQAPQPGNAQAISWRPFAREEVFAMVRDGRTVFVDVTADWCIVCKVNKALVIDTPGMAQRLSTDIVPVQADWTKPDDRIARFLNAFGRYGLPFNVVFGPGAPDGIVLPELLSRDALLAAFDRAASRQQSSSIK